MGFRVLRIKMLRAEMNKGSDGGKAQIQILLKFNKGPK
jgi:hypothetical protein